MSNLLVQNIKHTNNTTSMAIDTSGQVTIRGESSATTTKLQQGLAKAWLNVDNNGGFDTLDSFNLTSGGSSPKPYVGTYATGSYRVDVAHSSHSDADFNAMLAHGDLA